MTEGSDTGTPEGRIQLIDSILLRPHGGDFEVSGPQDIGADLELKFPNGKQYCIGYTRNNMRRERGLSKDDWEVDHVTLWADPTNPGRIPIINYSIQCEDVDLRELEEDLQAVGGLTLDEVLTRKFQILEIDKKKTRKKPTSS